jgi:hypothetical protein
MGYDHAVCPICAFIWHFDGLVEAGEIVHCDNCARDFRAGRWCGKHYPNALANLFSRPACPQCNSTNSFRGKKVGYGFPDLYMRQCQDCWSVWVARK